MDGSIGSLRKEMLQRSNEETKGHQLFAVAHYGRPAQDFKPA